MAQGKAMKDRTEADSEGLHYHFNFKKWRIPENSISESWENLRR